MGGALPVAPVAVNYLELSPRQTAAATNSPRRASIRVSVQSCPLRLKHWNLPAVLAHIRGLVKGRSTFILHMCRAPCLIAELPEVTIVICAQSYFTLGHSQPGGSVVVQVSARLTPCIGARIAPLRRGALGVERQQRLWTGQGLWDGAWPPLQVVCSLKGQQAAFDPMLVGGDAFVLLSMQMVRPCSWKSFLYDCGLISSVRPSHSLVSARTHDCCPLPVHFMLRSPQLLTAAAD